MQQAARAEHHGDGAAGATAQVGCQAVVLEVGGDHHRLAGRAQHIGPGQKIARIDVAVLGQEVAHGDLHDLDDVVLRRPLRLGEGRARAGKHVDVDLGHRTEGAALDEHRLVMQHLGGL